MDNSGSSKDLNKQSFLNKANIFGSLSKTKKSKLILENISNILGGKITIYVIGIFAVLLILVFLISQFLPVQNWFRTNKSIDYGNKVGVVYGLNEDPNSIYRILTPTNSLAMAESTTRIKNYLKDRYGYSVGSQFVSYNFGGSYIYVGDNYITNQICKHYEVVVEFSPKLSELAKVINAYVSAVDGVLNLYMDSSTYENIDIQIDKDILDENLNLSSDAVLYLKENASGLISSKTLEKIKKYRDKFFIADPNTSRWKDSNFSNEKMELEHYIKYVEGLVEEPIYELDTLTGKQIKVGSNYVVVYEPYNAYRGTVTINMFYDLSCYRKDELEECIEKLKGTDVVKTFNLSAEEIVREQTETYFYNLLSLPGESKIEQAEAYQKLMSKYYGDLIENNLISSIPIYGIPESIYKD